MIHRSFLPLDKQENKVELLQDAKGNQEEVKDKAALFQLQNNYTKTLALSIRIYAETEAQAFAQAKLVVVHRAQVLAQVEALKIQLAQPKDMLYTKCLVIAQAQINLEARSGAPYLVEDRAVIRARAAIIAQTERQLVVKNLVEALVQVKDLTKQEDNALSRAQEAIENQLNILTQAKILSDILGKEHALPEEFTKVTQTHKDLLVKQALLHNREKKAQEGGDNSLEAEVIKMKHILTDEQARVEDLFLIEASAREKARVRAEKNNEAEKQYTAEKKARADERAARMAEQDRKEEARIENRIRAQEQARITKQAREKEEADERRAKELANANKQVAAETRADERTARMAERDRKEQTDQRRAKQLVKASKQAAAEARAMKNVQDRIQAQAKNAQARKMQSAKLAEAKAEEQEQARMTEPARAERQAKEKEKIRARAEKLAVKEAKARENVLNRIKTQEENVQARKKARVRAAEEKEKARAREFSSEYQVPIPRDNVVGAPFSPLFNFGISEQEVLADQKASQAPLSPLFDFDLCEKDSQAGQIQFNSECQVSARDSISGDYVREAPFSPLFDFSIGEKEVLADQEEEQAPLSPFLDFGLGEQDSQTDQIQLNSEHQVPIQDPKDILSPPHLPLSWEDEILADQNGFSLKSPVPIQNNMREKSWSPLFFSSQVDQDDELSLLPPVIQNSMPPK